jgi:glycosyltransferase involved in cell wall biosynthesis
MALTQWFRHCVRKPVLVTLHEHIHARMWCDLMMAQAADAIVSVRPDFQAGFVKGLSGTAASKPFYFIPNAPNLPPISRTDACVADVRRTLGIAGNKSIVSYFGLLYPNRGVELLFEIADPSRHHVVLIGGALEGAQDYHNHLAALANTKRWQGSATLTGFLPEEQAANLLACSDAVVLPFRLGGGIWNTSIHGARLQGTFVVATSTSRRGFDAARNTYWAAPDDVVEMRSALDTFLGVRRDGQPVDIPRWEQIADQHKTLYKTYLARAGRKWS